MESFANIQPCFGKASTTQILTAPTYLLLLFHLKCIYMWNQFLQLILFWVFSMEAKPEADGVEIARCSRGQYFGELALVANQPRAASAFAAGSVKCLGNFLIGLIGILKICVRMMG